MAQIIIEGSTKEIEVIVNTIKSVYNVEEVSEAFFKIQSAKSEDDVIEELRKGVDELKCLMKNGRDVEEVAEELKRFNPTFRKGNLK